MTHWVFESVLGVVSQLKIQILGEENGPQNGCFFCPFCEVYQYPCCVIILLICIGWYIMRCQLEPLPSYKHLSKFSYLIIFIIDTAFSFSLPTSLPVWGRVIGPTILGTYCNHPSSLRLYIFYRGLPATYCTIVACRLHMYSLIYQSLVTSNAASTKSYSHILPSPLPAVISTIYLGSCDEIPLAPSSSRPSPPIFLSRKLALPGLMFFASFPGFHQRLCLTQHLY